MIQMDRNLRKVWEIVKDRKPGCCSPWDCKESDTNERPNNYFGLSHTSPTDRDCHHTLFAKGKVGVQKRPPEITHTHTCDHSLEPGIWNKRDRPSPGLPTLPRPGLPRRSRNVSVACEPGMGCPLIGWRGEGAATVLAPGPDRSTHVWAPQLGPQSCCPALHPRPGPSPHPGASPSSWRRCPSWQNQLGRPRSPGPFKG